MRLTSSGSGLKVIDHQDTKKAKLSVHFDIEVNYLVKGAARYFLGRSEWVLPERKLVAFWGGVPHRIVATSPDVQLLSITVSLLDVLRLKQAKGMSDALLDGAILAEPVELTSPQRMERWLLEANSNESNFQQAAKLEILAALMRSQVTVPARRASASATTELEPVLLMCRHVTANLGAPLGSTDIADVAGLHPNYAMRLFKRLTGMTIQEYVVQCRMAEAQRLLLRTSGSVEEIGERAGFQCASQYYATFKRVTGITPLQYRKMHQI